MSHDAINSWVNGAKAAKPDLSNAAKSAAIQVVRRTQAQARGNLIMDIAERIRPHLLKMFDGVRDENGMLMQPAHVRGIALNMAQKIAKEQEIKVELKN
ncbi:MAG: hypothetical protein ABL867_10120 [Rickettsiales bacterium]